MIKIVQTVVKSKGYKYFLKPHPSENNFNFPLDENCLGVFGKEEKLRDTFDKATIAVISVSGTYLDAYTHGLRCLKYSSDVKFPIAVEEDCFSDAEELGEKIESWIHEENKDAYLKRVNGIYNSGWKPGLVKETIEGIVWGK